MSYSLNACAPEPVCQSSTTTFTDLNSIVSIDDFLGNPEDGTWVGQGDIKQYQSSALLTMPAQSGGSLMSSSTYMWYGNVRARLRTSRDQGVITAFILFSDVKDEIDYEFVGSELTTAQTNYYFQGIDNCMPLPAQVVLLCPAARVADRLHQTQTLPTLACPTRSRTFTITRSAGRPMTSNGSLTARSAVP